MTLVWLLCLVLVSACGKRGGGSKSDKRVRLSVQQMESLVASQEMSCPSRDCPEAVARLFIVDFRSEANSAMCSGSLVGPRLLLTNSHCLEHGSLNKVCQGFYAVFATRGHGMQNARCKEILFRHQNPQRSATGLSFQDYALVELDRDVPVRPLRIAREGFRNAQTIHPYVVDHVTPKLSRIVKLSCRVMEGQGATPRDKAFSECPVIGGNSGAPILNRDGDIAGVIFASTPTEVNESSTYNRRISAEGFGFGFSMNRILEDLERWL